MQVNKVVFISLIVSLLVVTVLLVMKCIANKKLMTENQTLKDAINKNNPTLAQQLGTLANNVTNSDPRSIWANINPLQSKTL